MIPNCAKAIGIAHCLHCGAEVKFEVAVKSVEPFGEGSIKINTEAVAYAQCACTKTIRAVS